ncbi:nucleotidyltransferase [candidate division WOR-3 bacterium]|nr:nucleotidyltransferase [candidate division WOR-3 bacterium]
MILYAVPRATKDIDFLIAVDDSNLCKLQKALSDFGTPVEDIGVFKIEDTILRIGRSPIQIDILNQASGVDIKDCLKRKNTVIVDGVEISVISKEDLIQNKKSSGRYRDLADIDDLLNID